MVGRKSGWSAAASTFLLMSAIDSVCEGGILLSDMPKTLIHGKAVTLFCELTRQQTTYHS